MQQNCQLKLINWKVKKIVKLYLELFLLLNSSNELDGSGVDKTFCDWTQWKTNKQFVTSGYIDVNVEFDTYKDFHMFRQQTKSK